MCDDAVVLPALIMVTKLNPLYVEKAALLGAMVRLDVELVADVFAHTDEIRDLRNRIRELLISEAFATLREDSLGGEDNGESARPADQQAALAAKHLFDR